MEISVVIPVYGCRAALPELHRRLTEVLKQITESYEIILVNDGCPQNSWEVIREICGRDSHVAGLELSRNFGQMKALLAGLDYSTGDWVVVMDCDLQDRPEEIPNLYRKAQEGYDYVIASRKSRRDSGLKKFFSGCFYSLYSYMTGVKFDPSLCGFSICSRKVIDEYCGMRELHRAFTMYLLWMGYHWTTVSVDHDERYEGKSGYSFRKKMRMATEVITSQSDKLLRLVTRIGIAIALLAFLLIIVSVVLYFTLDTQPGYTSTIAMIMLMGGLTIMAVGIAGLYIGNIFMEVKQRPLYIVRTILNKKEEEK